MMAAGTLLLIILSAALPIAAESRRGCAAASPPRFGVIAAFGSPKYFTDRYVQSDNPDVKLKVPDFDALFGEIQKCSPLARQAIEENRPLGISAIDNDSADVYKWKLLDSSPDKLVSRVEKIDNFQNMGVPLLRLRSTLKGPKKKRGLAFSELISTTELRSKWDATIAKVDTTYSAKDARNDITKFQGGKYGEATLFGIGYVKTKQSVVSPREQLTLCGLQEFPSGACMIWGVELEEDQNVLMPADEPKRMPRSTSHIFATTLIPTGEDTFDVEYLLQVEIGGFPGWLTGPIVVDAIRKTFRFADSYFRSGFEEDGALKKRLALLPDDEANAKDMVTDGFAELQKGITAFGEEVKREIEEVSKGVEEVAEKGIAAINDEVKREIEVAEKGIAALGEEVKREIEVASGALEEVAEEVNEKIEEVSEAIKETVTGERRRKRDKFKEMFRGKAGKESINGESGESPDNGTDRLKKRTKVKNFFTGKW